jgi:hypothetical protein
MFLFINETIETNHILSRIKQLNVWGKKYYTIQGKSCKENNNCVHLDFITLHYSPILHRGNFSHFWSFWEEFKNLVNKKKLNKRGKTQEVFQVKISKKIL